MAQDTLYGRKCKLVIQGASPTPGDYLNAAPGVGIEIDPYDDPTNPGLRIQFKVVKTLEKHPNEAEVIITNLSPVRRGSLQVKGLRVTLEAGYVSTGSTVIFRGDSRTTDHERKGADWETIIKAGDGERAFAWGRVNESFAAGTSTADIIKRLAQQSGLAMGNIPSAAPKFSYVFQNGYTVEGSVEKSLDRLIKGQGYTWSIQNMALQVLGPNDSLKSQVPQIDSSSGLIGSPEMGSPEKKGKPTLVKFTSLLVPVSPGSQVKLVSERYDGYVTCKKVEHEGDTMGKKWYSHIWGVLI